MKNILIIHQNLENGGAEKQIVYLTNLLSQVYNVHLVILENKNIVHSVNKNVDFIHLDYDESESFLKLGPIKSYKLIRNICGDIKEIIKRKNIDLVIAYKDREVLFSYIVSCFVKVKVLVSQRGDYNNLPLYWQIILKYVYHHCNGVIFQLPSVQKFYSMSDKNSKVIPNPSTLVFSDDIYGAYASKKILSAGRFQDRKRFDLLIKAFSIVNKKYPEYELFIYGDGNERKNLEALIDELKLSEKIHLPGFIKDVIRNNLDAEMFVFTSDSEGIPNILIEALSAGIPCIATDCLPGGADFLLNHGENGLLINRNSIDALVKSIYMYIENRQQALEYGKKGKRYMENFSEEIVNNKFLSYVNNILESR